MGSSDHRPPGGRAANLPLAVGALGVVYGDIGTNPLFAMREAFEARHHVQLLETNVVGLLSLIFWSLVLVISTKYLGLVMRADNDGEGGILALSALATGTEPAGRGRRWVYVLVGLFGAALLYGDGVITPAISVLAAVEGTTVAAPSLDAFVIPVAIVILTGLFLVQRKGTTAIGRVFGPVMIVWFVTLAVLGAVRIAEQPDVLRAVWPGHAVRFFADNGVTGFLVLGAVILVVVGGEALYADMGHFGRRPIMLGWYGLVLPSLVLVYFGQGALLIRDPSAIENPFYRMAPEWALYPLVVLATMATVIASQALISGAYSLTQQAVQLGYSPRVRVTHTSEAHIGQIYIGSVNWFLMLACIGLVLGFRESTNLAAAYGVAVTTTMVLTTVLFFVVGRGHFRWSPLWLVPLCAVMFLVDGAFFSATLFKIPDGGWFPLAMAAVIFTGLATWRTGRLLVQQRLLRGGLPIAQFVADLSAHPAIRVPGESAYLFATPFLTPPGLLANLRHNDSLHETVLLVAVTTEKRPRVSPARRAEVHDLGAGFYQVILHFGFMQEPDVPRALADHCATEVPFNVDSLSYFIGRESVRVTPRPGMARWREHLFALMSRNSGSAASHLAPCPPDPRARSRRRALTPVPRPSRLGHHPPGCDGRFRRPKCWHDTIDERQAVSPRTAPPPGAARAGRDTDASAHVPERLGVDTAPHLPVFQHAGRNTGRLYETTAMVLTFDPATAEAVICAAWGADTDWIRNIRARPALRVQIDRDSFVPEQRFLTAAEAFDVAVEFRRRHPRRLRLLARVLGWGDLRSDAAVRDFVRTKPFVAFRPARDT